MSRSLVVLGALSLACGSEESGLSDEAVSPSTTVGSAMIDAGRPGSPAERVPAVKDELRTYLGDRRYLGFAAEAAPHISTGPHMGRVRVHMNKALAKSLASGALEHPPGSAAVKELFDPDDSKTPSGWAVMVKLDTGKAGDNWYWYEQFDEAVLADATGAAGCVSCHRGGSNFVVTHYPLD